MIWTYDLTAQEADPGLKLLTHAWNAWQFPIKGRVLEIGCAESDLLERLAASPDCQVTGIDVRRRPEVPNATVIQGDALDLADYFAPSTFDLVILVGALEHVGLGFYGDRKAEYGDAMLMNLIADWLVPWGYCYADVPYSGGRPFFVSPDRCWRCYDDNALANRLDVDMQVKQRLYSTPEPHVQIIERPTEPIYPYAYCATLWRRV